MQDSDIKHDMAIRTIRDHIDPKAVRSTCFPWIGKVAATSVATTETATESVAPVGYGPLPASGVNNGRPKRSRPYVAMIRWVSGAFMNFAKASPPG